MKSRNLKIDFLKGIAIFCMVYGHIYSLSVFECEDLFLDGFGIHQLISLFHMPLFMLLSGYCFGYSMNKSLKELLLHRTISLLIPIVVWGTADYILNLILGISKPSLATYISICFTGHMWFITVLIACSAGLSILTKLLKGSWLLAALVGGWILMILGSQIMGSTMSPLLYFYPFYIGGFLIYQYSHILYDNRKKIASRLAVIFLLLWFFVGKDAYHGDEALIISFSDIESILGFFYIYLIRIGACGLILTLADVFYQTISDRVKEGWNRLGTHTLQIYVVHWIFYSLFDKMLSDRLKLTTSISVFVFSFLVVPAISYGICHIIIWLYRGIKKNKKLVFVLFGK